MLFELMPAEPEVAGLLALIRLHRAGRRPLRPRRDLGAAAGPGSFPVGPWRDTDWEQIVLLYGMLLVLAPSPVTRLHRAIALRYTTGPQAALTELDDLAGTPDN